MRPESIVRFEQLFFISIALGLVGFFVNFDSAVTQMNADPNVAALGMGSGSLIGVYLVGLAINLLLWFFIARKGSDIAKWIFVVFFVIGLLGLPGLFAAGLSLATVFGLIGFALGAYMVYLLFQPDAKAWFAGDGPTDPQVFD